MTWDHMASLKINGSHIKLHVICNTDKAFIAVIYRLDLSIFIDWGEWHKITEWYSKGGNFPVEVSFAIFVIAYRQLKFPSN